MTARTTPEGAREIPEATVARLPVYLRALTVLSDSGTATCSSDQLARSAGVNSAKLRKDLSYLGSYGTRGVGYDVEYLRYQIAREIGVTQDWPLASPTRSTRPVAWPSVATPIASVPTAAMLRMTFSMT